MNVQMKENLERKSTLVSETNMQVEEDLWITYKAERAIWSENMLIALEKGVKGNKWFSLIDKIASDRTLKVSWEKVRANAGVCGVDGITIERFGKDSQSRLLAVKEHLRNRSYQSKAVKRKYIEKSGSKEKRALGIPTVTDRIVQQAVRVVIEPIFEKDFSENSYGFRPQRSCHDALRAAEGELHKGKHYVLDIDIKGYFESIEHSLLLEKIEEKISDGRVLDLIEMFLKTGILEDGELINKEEGTPQGGVISPLLSNIYLNDLDHLMSRCGSQMIRYADDMVVICNTESEALKCLEKIKDWMSQAGLTLHPEKTRIVNIKESGSYFDFLGFRFKRAKRSGNLVRLVRPKSEKKLRDTVCKFTRRCNGHSLERIILKINQSLKGWFNYFKQANIYQFKALDSWIRMRLRSILRKRMKRKGRGRGSDHQRWPNAYFKQLGLFSLEHAKVDAISLHNGAKH